MPDKDVDQQESKSISRVKYKLTKKGKITLTLIVSSLAIECVIFILMGLSIINGVLPLILLILIQVFILIPLIILMIEIYNFNQINNKKKRKKSIKEESFFAGLIVGIFLGILWSGLFK